MYKRFDYLNSTDCAKQSMAMDNVGLDWNYAIARKIDRDLHERLLAFPAEKVQGFSSILPLISSGYFHTARAAIMKISIDDTELENVRDWLAESLEEADDT